MPRGLASSRLSLLTRRGVIPSPGAWSPGVTLGPVLPGDVMGEGWHLQATSSTSGAPSSRPPPARKPEGRCWEHKRSRVLALPQKALQLNTCMCEGDRPGLDRVTDMPELVHY